MNQYIDALTSELRTLVSDLGKGGGLISPSIYDTAQTLRFSPPREGSGPALQWLLGQQQADGGWGDPNAPFARDVPTLAALLALEAHSDGHNFQDQLEVGLFFLQQQAEQWFDAPMDAIPVATEMILPRLVHDAAALGLSIDPRPYKKLYALRERKCQQITKKSPVSGSAPTYSWEAWGRQIDPPLLDRSGGIGHSPAATAAWLRCADESSYFAKEKALAQQMLNNAAAATGLDLPGVVPNVWPITGFELAYGPYILLLTGLLEQPALQDVICTQVNTLEQIMRQGHGVSFGEYFSPDVDETALTVASLHTFQRPVDLEMLYQFKNGRHFYTFPHELNASVFSNAHALHALLIVNQPDPIITTFLLDRQCADGCWLADKWHSSWIYTTLEVLFVLSRLGYNNAVTKALDALLMNQKMDGGWGAGCHATRPETSYALIALHTLQKQGLLNNQATQALKRGYQWLFQQYRPHSLAEDRRWLGKELYTPYRVDRMYELSALLSIALDGSGA